MELFQSVIDSISLEKYGRKGLIVDINVDN